MDFKNLNADKNLILNKHFSAGRSGRKVEFIVPHYAAGDLSLEGYYSVWQNRQASAHYAIDSNGKCAQLVWDRDTAWSVGNWDANCKSISIEHSNRGDVITDACRETGAHLVAALCIEFKLGRPEWGKNVRMHRDFAATNCPGPLATTYKDSYIKRAQEWYDAMTAGGAAPAPAPAPQPAPQPAPSVGYTAKVATDVLRIRKGAGTNFPVAGSVKKGEVYTIVAESAGQGAGKWGKLKSGAGWVSLDYMQKTGGGSAPAAPAKKDNATIAREVLGGTCSDSRWSTWGNGDIRKQRLQAAGYDYNAVQAEVNRLANGGSSAPAPKKSVETIAKEIIRGTCSDSRWNTWGTGSTRVSRLRAAGYDPDAVQRRVNQML